MDVLQKLVSAEEATQRLQLRTPDESAPLLGLQAHDVRTVYVTAAERSQV